MHITGQQERGHSSVWLPRAFVTSREHVPGQHSSAASRGMLDAAVRGLEQVLRRYQRIYEYTADRNCIFRIAPGVAEDSIVLGDGTRIEPGDVILELHLWNEHLPAIPREGPHLAWGLVMRERAINSLALLAAHLEGDAYRDIKGLRGEAAFTSRIGRRQMLRVAQRYGFELFQGEPPLRRRFRFFWENFLIWGLIWTFNPGGLRGKSLIKERFELWISREELRRRYAGRPFSSGQPHERESMAELWGVAPETAKR